MTDTNIPATALTKLIALSDAAEFLSEKLIATEQAIASARQRLSGGFHKQSEYDDLRVTLDQLIADLPVLKRRCAAAEAIHSRCRAFIHELPKGTALEPVTVDVNGHDLAGVRTKIQTLEAELAALNSAPSADIEQRIRSYVESMAKPTITGVGKGEKLKVIWPGAGFDMGGPREYRADLVPMMAFLHGDRMVEALMGEIEHTASDVCPSVLTEQLEGLAYLEEALVAAAIADGTDVQRRTSVPPAAVLGVR
jgi:hypothetical protein